MSFLETKNTRPLIGEIFAIEEKNPAESGTYANMSMIGGEISFLADWVEKLEKRKLYDEQITPKCIVVTVVPNGGEVNSDTSIVSAYFHEGDMIICGLESHGTTGFEKKQLLKSHISALRKINRFKDSWIFFVPESNLDDAATILLGVAQKFERVHVYVDKDGLEGLKTKTWSKVQYTEKANDYLEKGRIIFDQSLVCANPFKPEDKRLEITKNEFMRQLRQWKKIIFQKGATWGEHYITCTGKTDTNGKLVPGQKDDMAMAFVMNAYSAYLIEKESLYF